MRFPAVLLAFALVLTAAFPARGETRSEAEEAYAALVETARAHVHKGPITAAGAQAFERMLSETTEIEELVDAIRRVEGALLSSSERAKADDLPGRLGQSREALGLAYLLGTKPGAVIRVRVRLVEGASAWDSVGFGSRLYPLFSATLEYRFAVPSKWVPEAHPGTPVAELPWACPRAKFERVSEEAVAKDPASWRSYVESAHAFVEGAVSAAHRTTLPPQLVVVEPPELGHVFRPASSDGLPVTRALVTIKDWAGEELTPHTTLPQMAEFRTLYDTVIRRDRQREIFANCALLAEKLVVEPLRPQVEAAERANQRAALAGYLHRTTQVDLVLADGPGNGAKTLATLPRGTEVEILEGVTLDDATPPNVRIAPMLKVQGGDAIGWIPTHRIVRWKVEGKQVEEPSPTLAEDVPDRREELGVTLRELAGTYFVHQANAERAKSDHEAKEEAESRALAHATLSRFCREKARFVETFGNDLLPDEVAAYRDQRNAARMPASVIDREIAATFEDAGCGP